MFLHKVNVSLKKYPNMWNLKKKKKVQMKHLQNRNKN